MRYGVEVRVWGTSASASAVCAGVGVCPDEWRCEQCAESLRGLPTLFIVEIEDDIEAWQYAALDVVTERTGWRVLDATVRPLQVGR